MLKQDQAGLLSASTEILRFSSCVNNLIHLVALCHGLDSVRSGHPTGIPAQVRVRTQRDFRETSLSICRLKFSISCDICNDPLVNSVVITAMRLTVHLSSAQFNVLCLRSYKHQVRLFWNRPRRKNSLISYTGRKISHTIYWLVPGAACQFGSSITQRYTWELVSSKF